MKNSYNEKRRQAAAAAFLNRIAENGDAALDLYVDSRTPVRILRGKCKHTNAQKPTDYMRGVGCKQCRDLKTKNKEYKQA